MTGRGIAFVAAVGAALIGGSAAHACKYNVRDIGFVDLAVEPFRFYGFVDSTTPEEVRSAFERISYVALMDAPVESIVVDVDAHPDGAGAAVFGSLGLDACPAAALVSPGGAALALPLEADDRPFNDALWACLDGVVSSPMRERIAEQTSATFGAVLLVDGPDPGQNRVARGVIEEALDLVKARMGSMPKTVTHPPVFLELDRESFEDERVLLWNLGLDPERIEASNAVVLYGRARMLGRPLRGEALTTDHLAAALSFLGVDCECGTDREWLYGPALLVKWDETHRALAAQRLGFDPENPVVKTEVSQILSNVGEGANLDPYSQRYGAAYDEIVLDALPEEEANAHMSPAQLRQAMDVLPEVEPLPAESASPRAEVAAGDASWRMTTYLVGGAAALTVLIGAGILLRARMRQE